MGQGGLLYFCIEVGVLKAVVPQREEVIVLEDEQNLASRIAMLTNISVDIVYQPHLELELTILLVA